MEPSPPRQANANATETGGIGRHANALIPDTPFLMYIITACVFRDGDST